MKKVRVLLAEDHTVVKQGMIELLEKNGEMMVVAETEDGNGMINKYFDFKPDIVISDIEMPGMKGIEAAKEILHRDKKAKILFLTAYNTEEYIYWANKIGALGMISKTVSPSELFAAVKIVAGGEKYFMNKSNTELEEIFTKYELKIQEEPLIQHYKLTIREKEVLRHIAEGLKSDEIADKMALSKKSIDVYRAKIMRKLNLTSFAQLMKYAVEYTNSISESD